MRGGPPGDLARRVAFFGVNFGAGLILWALVLAPALNLVASRNARIRSQQALLTRYRTVLAAQPSVARYARILKSEASKGLFLTGADDGVVNAALQERLKTLADEAKDKVASVQSLPALRLGRRRFVGARIELIGAPDGVLAAVYKFENSSPLLIVEAGIMRPTFSTRTIPGVAPTISAQFDVYGARLKDERHE